MKTITFSGWTRPHDALNVIAPEAEHIDYSRFTSIGQLTDAWEKEADVVIGWSLGGMIARQLILHKKLSPDYLILIATPYQFVACDRFSSAMPAETFRQFYHDYRADTGCTIRRFHGLLAKGDIHARRLLNEYVHHPQAEDAARWLPWLDWLESYKANHHAYDDFPPTLIIHGRNDAIVPYEQGRALHKIMKHSHFDSIENCGHTPHRHDTAYVMESIRKFTSQNRA